MHAAVSGFLGLKVNFLLFWVVILLQSKPSKKSSERSTIASKRSSIVHSMGRIFFHSVLLNANKSNSLSLPPWFSPSMKKFLWT